MKEGPRAAWGPRSVVVIAVGLLLAACTLGGRGTRPDGGSLAPYPQSRLAVTWDFAPVEGQRRAHGSDLWPCAWAADGDLYCAWGDGGGFDGDADNVGRVSLGFARLSGTPNAENPATLAGTNIWGAPPYAQVAAQFGGKVGSMISVDGVLYALGGFWTAANSPDPVHTSGLGPVSTIAWSADAAKTWQLAGWSSTEPWGDFLDAGQDSTVTPVQYVYLYYMRRGDGRHVYLKRVHARDIAADPTQQGAEYFSGTLPWFDPSRWLHSTGVVRPAHWSATESAARPVFTDANNVEEPSVAYDAALRRYLLTAGHYASGRDEDASAGQVGLFEAPNPWGPWRTVGYYDNWDDGDHLNAESRGDFLGLRLPSKWLGADGKTIWAVFSGLKKLDSFNIAKGVLVSRRRD